MASISSEHGVEVAISVTNRTELDLYSARLVAAKARLDAAATEYTEAMQALLAAIDEGFRLDLRAEWL
jgi:hypothetical protein